MSQRIPGNHNNLGKNEENDTKSRQFHNNLGNLGNFHIDFEFRKDLRQKIFEIFKIFKKFFFDFLKFYFALKRREMQ